MDNKKFFFNGLNELRAIAAISVIFHHIELFKDRDGIASLYNVSSISYFIEKLGKNGVYLFFVLSGFLITFLLMQEKTKHHTILLKKFFLRRIFRIWPLYYIIVLISFVLIPLLAHSLYIFSLTPYYYSQIIDPVNYSLKSVLLYLLFLPNVALRAGITVVGASQAWSVGVEEQFYILWPFLILLFSRKYVVWVFGFILCSFVLLHIVSVPLLTTVVRVVPFEFMAIGGIGGFLYFHRHEDIRKITKSKYLYALIAGLTIFFAAVPVLPLYIQNIILSFLFLALIVTTINDENPWVLRNRTFSFLGKISYGIYMYHPFVMFLVFPVLINMINPQTNSIAFNVFIYTFVLGVTFLISHLSYKYLESAFIKIKDTKFKSL